MEKFITADAFRPLTDISKANVGIYFVTSLYQQN